MGEGERVCATLDVHCKFLFVACNVENIFLRCKCFNEETGVSSLLHGFENSFSVNKEKTLTPCVYLEQMINVCSTYKRIEF